MRYFSFLTFFQLVVVCPNAPIVLGQGSFAWWNIDIQGLVMKYFSGRMKEIEEETPVGFESASDALFGLVEGLKGKFEIPYDRFVLAGFSQGAMLSVEVMLRMKELPSALFIASASLICKGRWEGMGEKEGLKVVVSCFFFSSSCFFF